MSKDAGDPVGLGHPFVSVSDGVSGDYIFFQTTHISFSDSPPLQTPRNIMAYTRRDTEDAFLDPLSPPESAPQPNSPERHERANPPPPCVPAVSILRPIAFFSSMTKLFSSLHLSFTVPATAPTGMRPRCSRAFRTSVMACRCHAPMVWHAAMAFGPTHSRVLCSLLRWWCRQRRALPSLSSLGRPEDLSFFFIECCDAVQP